MRLSIVVVFSTIALACGREAPRHATGSTTVSGIVLERVDAPPYSFMRLETGEAQVWIAVPLTTAEQGGRVTVVNGATVRNFEAPSVGRRFDTVIFGVLERK